MLPKHKRYESQGVAASSAGSKRWPKIWRIDLGADSCLVKQDEIADLKRGCEISKCQGSVLLASLWDWNHLPCVIDRALPQECIYNFHPYLSPSHLFLLIRQISSRQRLNSCGHRASSVRAPHTTEVHRKPFPTPPIFIPNRQNFPHSYALKIEPSQPSTLSSPKKHRATQSTTSTTTALTSPTSVTPVAMTPSSTTTVATSSLPSIRPFATYDNNNDDNNHT